MSHGPDRIRFALVATTVAGLVVAGLQVWKGGSADDDAPAERAAATKVAADVVQTVVSTASESLDGDLASVLRHGTPGLKATLRRDVAPVVRGVKGGGVYLTGYVAESGLVALDASRAQVAVAAAGERIRSRTGARSAMRYDALVSLERQDGTWRVSRIRFLA